MKMNEAKTPNKGIADKLFWVRVGGNFWGGKYYENGVDSIVVSAKSKEEAYDIAIANKKAVVAHFHEKRIGSGKGRKALKTSDNNVKITKTVTPFVGDSFWRTLTRDGKFTSVKLTEEAKEQVMNEARLPAGKEKELRKKLKLINDFHWGTGDFKSPSSQKKKWEAFLHKNGWQGDVYVSADELQKFVDYGEKLMTGSNKGRKPKELRVKLKVINDFLSKRNKKWIDFLGKNGWQGIDTLKDSELQKFVDYGEELMTGKKMNEAALNEAKRTYVKITAAGDVVEDDEEEYTEVNFYVPFDDAGEAKAAVKAINKDAKYQDAVEEAAVEEVMNSSGAEDAYLSFEGAEIYKKAKPPKGDYEIEFKDLDNFSGNIDATLKESYDGRESETYQEFSTELEQMLNSKLFEAIEAKKRKIAGEISAELSSKVK